MSLSEKPLFTMDGTFFVETESRLCWKRLTRPKIFDNLVRVLVRKNVLPELPLVVEVVGVGVGVGVVVVIVLGVAAAVHRPIGRQV